MSYLQSVCPLTNVNVRRPMSMFAIQPTEVSKTAWFLLHKMGKLLAGTLWQQVQCHNVNALHAPFNTQSACIFLGYTLYQISGRR